MMIVLAVLIGLGVLVTEITYGQVFASQGEKISLSR